MQKAKKELSEFMHAKEVLSPGGKRTVALEAFCFHMMTIIALHSGMMQARLLQIHIYPVRLQENVGKDPNFAISISGLPSCDH